MNAYAYLDCLRERICKCGWKVAVRGGGCHVGPREERQMRYCSAGSRWHGVPGRRATTSAFATALNKSTKFPRSFNESWARIVIWRISSLEDFLALMDYGSSIPKDQNDQGPRHPGHMGEDTLGCRVGCWVNQFYIIKSKISMDCPTLVIGQRRCV